MKKEEYEYLQKRMSNLLEKAKSTYMSENKLEEYTKGILAAKSVLNDYFRSQDHQKQRLFCPQHCSGCNLTLDECRKVL